MFIPYRILFSEMQHVYLRRQLHLALTVDSGVVWIRFRSGGQLHDNGCRSTQFGSFRLHRHRRCCHKTSNNPSTVHVCDNCVCCVVLPDCTSLELGTRKNTRFCPMSSFRTGNSVFSLCFCDFTFYGIEVFESTNHNSSACFDRLVRDCNCDFSSQCRLHSVLDDSGVLFLRASHSSCSFDHH